MARILAHTEIAPGIWRLALRSLPIARLSEAGQFVMISVPDLGSGTLLPRPMAIHRRYPDAGWFEVIYNVQGPGTRSLAQATPGQELLVTGPLGRAFEVAPGAASLLMLGRGIGVCGLMTAAEDALESGTQVTMVLSARERTAVIGESDCVELNARNITVSDDVGDSGVESLEIRLHNEFDARPPSALLVCGSSRLARMGVRLAQEWGTPAQVSVEAHMACGLGYCHGCAINTPAGGQVEGPLVCVDGPVFELTPQL